MEKGITVEDYYKWFGSMPKEVMLVYMSEMTGLLIGLSTYTTAIEKYPEWFENGKIKSMTLL